MALLLLPRKEPLLVPRGPAVVVMMKLLLLLLRGTEDGIAAGGGGGHCWESEKMRCSLAMATTCVWAILFGSSGIRRDIEILLLCVYLLQ